MKTLKKIIFFFATFCAVVVALLYIFDYEYILKGVKVVYFTGHKTAYIEDTPNFETHTIEKGTTQRFQLHKNYNKTQVTKTLNDIHNRLGTVAFLVIKNDSIWHEKYYDGFSSKSKTNSFSMAKSITSALLFKAIQQGHIPSLNTPVHNYLPELKGTHAKKLTVGDLSSMASGLNWNENYISPFSMTAKAYYDTNIRELMLGLKVTEQPGQSFKYLSGATQLLAMCIEKATKQPLAKYLSSYFWRPMGMHTNALWQIDGTKSQLEKAYCCIASNARDFGRFGQLWLKNGNWNGSQIIPKELAKIAQKPRFKGTPYGYGLWLSNHKNKNISYMRGILGQYVICIPEDDLVIVRLGHLRNDPLKDHTPGADFYTYIDEVYTMLNQEEKLN